VSANVANVHTRVHSDWSAGAAGFFLPLSGGADSSSTCAIVGVMCHMVVAAAAAGDEQV
jgi:hypothetical protein